MSNENETQEANAYLGDVTLTAIDFIRKMILCIGGECRTSEYDCKSHECKFKPSPNNEWHTCKHIIKEAKEAAVVMCDEIISANPVEWSKKENVPDEEEGGTTDVYTCSSTRQFWQDVKEKIKSYATP